MSLEAAITLVASALVTLIGAVAAYIRAVARRVDAQTNAQEAQARRIDRISRATGVDHTPPFGVEIQPEKSEPHRR